jgi:hypothetical protein
MSKFKKGDKVTQVLTDPVTGVVDSFEIDKNSGERQIRVVYGENGEHHRFFNESELKATEASSD